MHFSNIQYKNRTTRGGGVLLLKKIKVKPLPLEFNGGAITSNRMVGITSNPVRIPPPSVTMASVGGSIIDFNKQVKASSKNIQKKKDKEENIRFVY